MHSNNRFESKLVRFMVEGAASESARSLELLRVIETTVQINDMFSEGFEQNIRRFSQAVEVICGRQADAPKEPIDPDGSIRILLESTLDNLDMLVARMRGARHSAIRDAELRDDDGVVESFDRAILAITEMHSMLNELNWAILEHDADRSPLSGKGPFRTVEELLAAIGE